MRGQLAFTALLATQKFKKRQTGKTPNPGSLYHVVMQNVYLLSLNNCKHTERATTNTLFFIRKRRKMRLKHILNETQRMKTDWKNLIFTKQKSKKEIKNKTREIKKRVKLCLPVSLTCELKREGERAQLKRVRAAGLVRK